MPSFILIIRYILCDIVDHLSSLNAFGLKINYVPLIKLDYTKALRDIVTVSIPDPE